ncbi:hypothetical protein ACSSWA_08635 [Melioribacter sp. Ez-97]|uniref:hypothetical protein n=1 Tax=Melioribacter sp. Ez-97 TaxID=3423434 RepID=UPI003EDB3CFA
MKNFIAGLSVIILLSASALKAQSIYEGIDYASETIISLKGCSKDISDVQLVDSLYGRVLDYYDGDISETLLALTFACLPFDKINVRFLLGSRLTVPLPSPSESIFKKRLENLPSNLFYDSPNSDFGDKDKLSHFFGNAFLAYNFGCFNLSDFIGIFVENIEQELFIEGDYSFKDILVNGLGKIYGYNLRKNKNLKPSDFLNFYHFLFMRF